MVAVATPIIGRSASADSSGTGSTLERPWFVRGATTEGAAIAAVATAASPTVSGLLLRNIEIREEVEDGYECMADYGVYEPRRPPAVGESYFNFEIGTVPVRVNVPLSPQTVYARAGEPVPEDSEKWLIGQQGDGSAPEGVEIYEPNATFSETHYLSDGVITAAQQRTLLRTVGKLNESAFRGWLAEEVLCIGVTGSKRGSSDWEISFRFQVKEHQTGLEIAGITGINKKGWEHIWPYHELEKDGGDAPIISNIIKYMVVAEVFQTADFSLLY